MEIAVNSTGSKVLARDEFGNVRGGLRLPKGQVPIAAYNGEDNGLDGNTYNFTASRLDDLLYSSHDDYVTQVVAAASTAEKQRIILPSKVRNYILKAEQANVPPARGIVSV
ncbi:uncharacterized protein PV07_08763 [Cladophialophora immunda]|uniref:Alpha/beta hydrolase domain-containing protein n=1 Tax=Cladophialophora immunda TaxID=569365 RepID=A0A0D2AKU5_9EURO|nr:uncharacterized protein PV07_08763 [Cladophialophora immunda]KIW25597.1 hypothetical protein PV07_08763 [Cladophialophora immunda]OQV07700.1 hypothetical protein CLAIMM_12099 [Cladophialophora immunda]